MFSRLAKAAKLVLVLSHRNADEERILVLCERIKLLFDLTFHLILLFPIFFTANLTAFVVPIAMIFSISQFSERC